MKAERFKAIILSGHKENAVEVPFNPATRWDAKPRQLWPGRRGFRVVAEINGKSFESAIVSRSRKFWLLLPEAAETAAHVASGDEVIVSARPTTET